MVFTSRPIVILGMHRSGTSCITKIINVLGAYCGLEQDLTGANIENPQGFYERHDLRRVCDALLHQSGSDWWKISQFSDTQVSSEVVRDAQNDFERIVEELNSRPVWVIKEPRLCLLLPFFQAQLSNPIFVHIYRNPVEVASSLHTRNGFSIGFGLALWEAYNLSAIKYSAKNSTIRISYNALLREPHRVIHDLVNQLESLDVPHLFPPDKASVESLVIPGLYRERFPGKVSSYLRPSQSLLWSYLEKQKHPKESADDIPLSFQFTPSLVADLQDGEASQNISIELKDTQRELDVQLKIVKSKNDIIQQRDQEIVNFKVATEDLEKNVQEIKGALKQKEEIIVDVSEKLKSKGENIRTKEEMIEQQKKVIDDLKKAVSLRTETIQKRDKTLKRRQEIIEARENLIRKKDALISKLRQEIITLTSSKSWKIATLLTRVYSNLVPEWLKPLIFRSVRFLYRTFRMSYASLVSCYLAIKQVFSPRKLASNVRIQKWKNPYPTHQQTFPILESKLTVDIVVCIHNGLYDVQRCLESVKKHSQGLNKIIVVNDGSESDTEQFIAEFSEQCTPESVQVITHNETRGYTKSANVGLKASSSDYIILLNSDTIVSQNWIPKLISIGESDLSVGIIGPLSNAASWQSIPETLRRDRKDWSTNEFPEWLTPEAMAQLVELQSPTDDFPRVPILNGFCLAIKRKVIQTIGYLDEENFPIGYGEENDYCFRAIDAGFSLAVATHCYVHHAKSKSFSHTQRKKLSQEGDIALIRKYGQSRIHQTVEVMRRQPELSMARERISLVLKSMSAILEQRETFSVLFLLPVEGGSGGAHSVMQEVNQMQTWGINAKVAVPKNYKSIFEAHYYEDFQLNKLVIFYGEEKELIRQACEFQVCVATIFTSVALLKQICDCHPHIVPAYYAQDYEPLFEQPSFLAAQATKSYALVEGMVIFAKTDWICQMISSNHGVRVHQVAPSLDTSIFHANGVSSITPDLGKPVTLQITAMVRMNTSRRAPERTLKVLSEIWKRFPNQIKIQVFGSHAEDLKASKLELPSGIECVGHLTRTQVSELLRASDIFIDLSHYQAFGRSGLEAMACGTAVVLPEQGGVSTYANHGYNALVIDTSQDELCIAEISKLIENPLLMKKLKKAGIQTAQKFSVEKAVYSEIILLVSTLLYGGKEPENIADSREISSSSDFGRNKHYLSNLPASLMPNHLFADYTTIESQYSDLKSLTSDTERASIAVIIPVFNAYEEVKKCINSVLATVGSQDCLLIVDDCSTDRRIKPLLSRYSKQNSCVKLIENKENIGYTATINKAIRSTRADVILLNSDTIVSPLWINFLHASAYSQASIGTVTAISNNAGAFSIPQLNQVNALPDGITLQVYAELVQDLAQRRFPNIPSGNGFCMYIKRSVFEKVGYFDVESFPRGYGEENDFCLRAEAAGFENIIDDCVYIFHKRSASFKEEKHKLIENSKKILRSRYPNYKSQVNDFLANHPLQEVSQKLDTFMKEQRFLLDSSGRAEEISNRKISLSINQELYGQSDSRLNEVGKKSLNILFIIHNGGGGSVLTNWDLINHLPQTLHSYLLVCDKTQWRLIDCHSKTEIEIVTFQNSWQFHKLPDIERLSFLERICIEYRIDVAHVRSLVCFYPEALRALRILKVKVVFSLHDFYTICPSIQLIDNNGQYCGGHCSEGEEQDCRLSRWCDHPPHLKHSYIHVWRQRLRLAFQSCDCLVTTSISAYDTFHKIYPSATQKLLTVVEHGRDKNNIDAPIPPLPKGRCIKILCLGNINEAKGSKLLQQIFLLNNQQAGESSESKYFEFHILGNVHRGFNTNHPHVHIHGPYDREQLSQIVSDIQPSFSLIASIWPETYCHTLTESWFLGLPAFASDIGTLRERITIHGGGWLLEYSSARLWYEQMLAIIQDTDEYLRKIEDIKSIQLRTVKEMVSDYVHIYEQGLR